MSRFLGHCGSDFPQQSLRRASELGGWQAQGQQWMASHVGEPDDKFCPGPLGRLGRSSTEQLRCRENIGLACRCPGKPRFPRPAATRPEGEGAKADLCGATRGSEP